jgi:hypothetical protein
MWHLKSKPDTVVSVLARVMTHEHCNPPRASPGLHAIRRQCSNQSAPSTFLHLALAALEPIATIPFPALWLNSGFDILGGLHPRWAGLIRAALHLEAGPIRCVRGLKSSLVISQKAPIGPNPFTPRGRADLVV